MSPFSVEVLHGWEDFRLKLARLILALAERNPSEVARYESDLGGQEFCGFFVLEHP